MVHKCQSCGGDLKKIATASTTKTYKAKRYECIICGSQETIFGKWDLDQSNTLKQIDKMYKEQEENNG